MVRLSSGCGVRILNRLDGGLSVGQGALYPYNVLEASQSNITTVIRSMLTGCGRSISGLRATPG